MDIPPIGRTVIVPGNGPVQNDTVHRVQTALNELAGYPRLAPNGVLDVETQDAIARFQSSEGLAQTGTIDQATITALNRELERAQARSEAASSGPEPESPTPGGSATESGAPHPDCIWQGTSPDLRVHREIYTRAWQMAGMMVGAAVLSEVGPAVAAIDTVTGKTVVGALVTGAANDIKDRWIQLGEDGANQVFNERGWVCSHVERSEKTAGDAQTNLDSIRAGRARRP